MSKDGKRPERGGEVIDFRAAQRERAAFSAGRPVSERERTRDAISVAVTSREPTRIIEAWKLLESEHATGTIPRAGLRRMDMHIALAGADVIDHVAKKDTSVRALVDVLATQTQGGRDEPEAQPMTFERLVPFAHLRALSENAQSPIVEADANNRTEDEHRRARLGVEVALLATRMDQVLHILKNSVGTTLGKKLTTLEKAALNDHIERILQGGHWSHPTQDMANTFVTWEDILGNAHRVNDTRVLPEPANFRTEEPARAEQKPKPHVPFVKNLMRAPADALNELRKLLSDE